ncbi:Cyanovirin-N [Auricularia subglabra TFB-10046 SS5]|uniref:Cyanovirin-N n=1 Tax=Auricularia subglabra (strain TFB-10046 / SS5) TaxID=717982 RepID=J0LDI5_AURST|nr:Cyanovirin-N [Auricularia subglabra TFB-10046 SS5]
MQISLNLFALAAFAVAGAHASSNFVASCNGVHLSGTEPNLDLVATCLRSGGGSSETSSIALNGCYTNTNGQLKFQKNGNAFHSCHDCTLSGTVLDCICQRTSGADTSAIDLNVNIGNSNGQLVC